MARLDCGEPLLFYSSNGSSLSFVGADFGWSGLFGFRGRYLSDFCNPIGNRSVSGRCQPLPVGFHIVLGLVQMVRTSTKNPNYLRRIASAVSGDRCCFLAPVLGGRWHGGQVGHLEPTQSAVIG